MRRVQRHRAPSLRRNLHPVGNFLIGAAVGVAAVYWVALLLGPPR